MQMWTQSVLFSCVVTAVTLLCACEGTPLNKRALERLIDLNYSALFGHGFSSENAVLQHPMNENHSLKRRKQKKLPESDAPLLPKPTVIEKDGEGPKENQLHYTGNDGRKHVMHLKPAKPVRPLSYSVSTEESNSVDPIELQRDEFLQILDEHKARPKKTKQFHDPGRIRLTRDVNGRYSIVEASESQESM